MNQIFSYDYGAPIAFYVDAHEGDLGQRIVRHGGSLTSALQAQIHLGGRTGAAVLPMDPNVPVLHPAWVTESIRVGRMLPVYPYLDDPAQDMLQSLSVEHRDVAELLKARVGNAADSVFRTLHQKFPHNSTQMWRALYESSQVVIQFALARFVPANQMHLNAIILPIFPQTALLTPTRQRSPRELDIADRNYIPGGPTEDQDDDMVVDDAPGGVANYRRAASDVSSHPTSDTPARTPVRRRQARPGFIADDDQDEGEEVITDDDDYTDRRCISPSGTPEAVRPSRQKGARIGRGVRLTQLDYERMARFIMTLGREPGLPDWVDFWNMDPINQNRSFSAWNIQYYQKKAEIAAARARLGAREE